MKRVLILSTLILTLLILPAQATGNASEASANASAMLSTGVGSVIVGSASLVAASGQLMVESLEKSAEGVVFVLKGVGQGASEAGKIIAFIPNEIGQPLIHHSRVSG